MATASTNLSSYNLQSVPDGTSFKIHLVVSQWNENITSDLREGVINTLLKNNVQLTNIKVWYVPGSFELVYGTKKAQSFDPDAVIAIGSIIQGQTKHFDFVCEAVTQGIKDLNLQSEVPAIFCVLTDHNLNQAQDRSGGKYGNKGVEAAVAALKMIQLRNTH
tara:strand:- start:128 stop:613 length:486 start_codon:yes stop_codon:yes gene_type:complete